MEEGGAAVRAGGGQGGMGDGCARQPLSAGVHRAVSIRWGAEGSTISSMVRKSTPASASLAGIVSKPRSQTSCPVTNPASHRATLMYL